MEKLNLVELLKNCPEDMELYSPAYGALKFYKVDQQIGIKPSLNIIFCYDSNVVYSERELCCRVFKSDGSLLNSEQGECMLFPAENQRDWNKFKTPPKVLQICPDRIYWFQYSEQYGYYLYDKLFELIGDYEFVEGVREGQIVYSDGKKIKTVDESDTVVDLIRLIGVQLKIEE